MKYTYITNSDKPEDVRPVKPEDAAWWLDEARAFDPPFKVVTDPPADLVQRMEGAAGSHAPKPKTSAGVVR